MHESQPGFLVSLDCALSFSGGRPHQDRGYRRCSDRIRVSEHPAEVSSRIAVALVRAFGWN